MTGENKRKTGEQEQREIPKLSGIVLDEEHLLTLTEISQACAVQTGYIIELVDEGLLIPESDPEIGLQEHEPHFWRFTGEQMRRARMASRLQDDLGINLAGVALVLQLLDEIETLRGQLEAVGLDDWVEQV